MKISNISDEFQVDEFPKICLPEQKVLLTSFLEFKYLRMPKHPIKIYTTETIAKQFKIYFEDHGTHVFKNHHFVIIRPFELTEVALSCGEKFEILALESTEIERSLMVLLRINAQVTHFYAGVSTDVRATLSDNLAAKWISEGIDNLYLNLKRAEESCHPRELQIIIEKIEELLDNDNEATVQVVVPILISTQLVAALANHFRKRVFIEGVLKALYQNLADLNKFQSSKSRAKIIITRVIPSKSAIQQLYTTKHVFTVFITEQPRRTVGESDEEDKPLQGAYNELRWSPLPTPFHLQMLSDLVCPQRIYAIIKRHTYGTRVPEYLLMSCHGGALSNQKKMSTKATVTTESPKPDTSKSKSSEKAAPGPSDTTEAQFRLASRRINYIPESESDDSL